MSQSELFIIVGSASFAALVAVGVTVAIEKWGGVIGGLLGTLPTTIVPASIRFTNKLLISRRSSMHCARRPQACSST